MIDLLCAYAARRWPYLSAADLVQDAYIRAWEKGLPMEKAIMFHLVRCEALNAIRYANVKKRGHPKPLIEATDPAPGPAEEAEYRELLARLPAADRELLAAYLQESTISKTAERLGLPETTVEWRLRRIREWLQAA